MRMKKTRENLVDNLLSKEHSSMVMRKITIGHKGQKRN